MSQRTIILSAPAFFLFVILFLAAAPTRAQVETVRGKLVRKTADTTHALPNAGVTLETAEGRRSNTVYTNDEGYFYFRNIPPGEYTIEFSLRSREEPIRRSTSVPDDGEFHDLGTFAVQ